MRCDENHSPGVQRIQQSNDRNWYSESSKTRQRHRERATRSLPEELHRRLLLRPVHYAGPLEGGFAERPDHRHHRAEVALDRLEVPLAALHEFRQLVAEPERLFAWGLGTLSRQCN